MELTEKEIIKNFKEYLQENEIKLDYKNYKKEIDKYVISLHYDIVDNVESENYIEIDNTENKIAYIVNQYIVCDLFKIYKKNQIKFKDKIYKLYGKIFSGGHCTVEYKTNNDKFLRFTF